MSNVGKRKYIDIHQVCGNIDDRNDQRAEKKRQPDISPGIFDFSRNKRNVIPRVATEYGSYHGSRNGPDQDKTRNSLPGVSRWIIAHARFFHSMKTGLPVLMPETIFCQ